MILRQASPLDLVDQEGAVVPGGAAYVHERARRLAPSFERAEPRHRAMADGRGLLSPAERKNTWPVAEVSGDTTPYALQHRLRRALWEPDAVRDELTTSVVQHLGAPHAVLVLDETGLLKKGDRSAGVARQDRGTAGRIDNCQIGVFWAYAGGLGHTLLDRERYRPKAWPDERARCRQAGIPDEREFATKPQRARQMLARAFATGVPATWVTADSVDGDARRLRRWLASRPQADVLAVSGKEDVGLEGQQRQVKRLLGALPDAGWTRLRAGEGAKGPRWDDWRWWPWADPLAPAWRRWRLVRRRVTEPTDRTASVVFALQEALLAEVVRVAGARWTIAPRFDVATGEVGLDHDDVRSWTGWDSASHARHVGARPAHGPARGGQCRGNVQKQSPGPPGAQPFGGVQGQSRPRLPRSVPDVRRRLWRLVLVVQQTVPHMLAWSRWRRWHHSRAKDSHDQRRGALAELLVAYLPL